MKEKIGMHFSLSFIYIVIARNFLGDDALYTTTITSFQKSLIYCLFIAVFLTTLLEAWDIIKEISIHKINPLAMMYATIVISLIAIYLLDSMYYTIIIIFLVAHICQDCWRMNVMNKQLKKIAKQ